jgi:hypothetical protein
MLKYRRLTLEELNEMEKEFVNFLVINSITAQDWERLKAEGLADPIIEQFSDVVFETIMRKVEFMECYEKKSIKSFQCLPDKLVMVCLTSTEDNSVDFSDPSYMQKAFQEPPGSLKIFTTEKLYSKQRELELFEMTEAGCTISDGKLFKSLCLALKE